MPHSLPADDPSNVNDQPYRSSFSVPPRKKKVQRPRLENQIVLGLAVDIQQLQPKFPACQLLRHVKFRLVQKPSDSPS